MSLTDSKGKEVATPTTSTSTPTPCSITRSPRTAPYTLEIHDSIYRGREDFVYRIAVGELPFVTSIFPLGGKTGARIPVELHGWNLPAAKIVEDAKGKPAGVYPIAARAGEWTSNPCPSPSTRFPKPARRSPTTARRTPSASGFP